MHYVLTYEFSKIFATFILQFFLEDHRIPINIDINERIWFGRSGANGRSLMFVCRNRLLY